MGAPQPVFDPALRALETEPRAGDFWARPSMISEA